MDTKAPLFIHRVFLPGLNDLIDQLGDAQYVLVGLRWQAQHEIELDVVPAAGEGLTAGVEDFLLRQILIDHVPQALGTRLGSKGQTAFSHRLQLFHQLPGEIVGA